MKSHFFLWILNEPHKSFKGSDKETRRHKENTGRINSDSELGNKYTEVGPDIPAGGGAMVSMVIQPSACKLQEFGVSGGEGWGEILPACPSRTPGGLPGGGSISQAV